MAILQLDERGSGYVLRTRYEDRHIAREAGGRWDPGRRVWRLPPDTDLDRLRSLFGSQLIIEEPVRQRLARLAEERKRLAGMHLADDALIRYPQGLDPYQRVGVRFLADAGRALLADPPGLGKTAQAIRACDEVSAERVLVVTKKSLIHQWRREITRFACTPWGYEVLNYEQAVRRLGELKSFDVLIVDEATRIKNRKAQRTKAVHQLARRAKHVWLLTGTPIHNRPDELWSLLHALRPEVYTSYWRWVERRCILYETPWAVQVAGVKDPKALQEELAPLMLRRDKSLLGLPSKSHETLTVELSGEQARLYRQMEKAMIAVLAEDKLLTAPSVLAQLTRLRQIALDHGLVGGQGRSAKTEALLDLAEDLAADHKLLVFTCFAQYATRVVEALREYGAVAYHGQMSGTARDAAVQRFQEDSGCRVLVGTIEAMGEGLNLTAANIVVFADKHWVPAMNEQAEDRAHRRGQEKPVHVISLVAADTVDEYVEEVIESKLGMIREVEVAREVIARMLGGGRVRV